jgi:hypothetical protein
MKLYSEELHNLYLTRNITRQIKSRRMGWAGYVAHMGEKCPRFWWEIPRKRDLLEDRGIDEIRLDLVKICWARVEWIQLAQDRGWW